MENFSENQKGKKRGRPPLLPYEVVPPATNPTSRRAFLNDVHLGLALATLFPKDEEHAEEEALAHYAWLCGGDLSGAGFKKTILVELGRLRDGALIRKAADIICKRKIKTPDAIPWLRHMRSQGDKVGSIDGLTQEIARLIDDYKCRYRGTEWAAVLEALNNAYCLVSELQRIEEIKGDE